MPPLSILEKIHFKKNIYFSKKPQILTVLRILANAIAFYGKFATIWWKNDIHTREEPKLACLRELNWQTSGKKTHLFERKILLSIFSIWRKIILSVKNISTNQDIDICSILSSNNSGQKRQKLIKRARKGWFNERFEVKTDNSVIFETSSNSAQISTLTEYTVVTSISPAPVAQ